jgi:hypothetical protein
MKRYMVKGELKMKERGMRVKSKNKSKNKKIKK